MTIDEVLPADDREITVRPFDARWEAVITVYGSPDRQYRGVDRIPSRAVEMAQELAAK